MAVAKVFVVLIFAAVAVNGSPLAKNANDASELSLEDNLAKFIERQEISFEIPYVGSTVSFGARNLGDDELDMKIKVSGQEEGRKSSKLKKVFAPLLILTILKAITLIPLALGILGLKTWNAIQLSFVTFVISIALAVFELCKKVASDHHGHPAVYAHAPWHAAAASRSFPEAPKDAQDIAYSAYVQ